MLQGLAREHAEEVGARKPKGKGQHAPYGSGTPEKVKAQVTEEFPGIPKDLWGVRMWSMSFGLLYRKLWSWWPFSALKIYECVISKIALKISPKRLYLPFVSFIINWKDIPLEKSFLFSVLYSNFSWFSSKSCYCNRCWYNILCQQFQAQHYFIANFIIFLIYLLYFICLLYLI